MRRAAATQNVRPPAVRILLSFSFAQITPCAHGRIVEYILLQKFPMDFISMVTIFGKLIHGKTLNVDCICLVVPLPTDILYGLIVSPYAINTCLLQLSVGHIVIISIE